MGIRNITDRGAELVPLAMGAQELASGGHETEVGQNNQQALAVMMTGYNIVNTVGHLAHRRFLRAAGSAMLSVAWGYFTLDAARRLEDRQLEHTPQPLRTIVTAGALALAQRFANSGRSE